MLAAGHPQALALWGGLNAVTAVAPSPTPGLPPEAFAPGGPAGPPAPVQAGAGSPAPADLPVPAETGKRKRRTKAEMAADAAAALVSGSDAARDELVQGFEARDTDHSELALSPDVSAHALTRIADALEKLCMRLGY